MSNLRKQLTLDEIYIREKSIVEFEVHFKEMMAVHRHVIIQTVYHGLIKYSCDKCDCQMTYRVIPGLTSYHFVEMQSSMRMRCKRLDILL